jgi:DNA-binding IclR family transcriptional regulator
MNAVRSADRALAIFEAFEEAGRQLQLREIAERCQMPVSTCHALVQTLLARGYLYTMGRRKELYPNRKLLRLAQNIVAHEPHVDRIAPELEKLRDACGETVVLGKRQGDVVTYLLALEGNSALRFSARAGDIRPLHAGAMGKVFLAEMAEEELRAWLKAHPLKRITARTIVDPSALVADLERARKRGYFVASGENLESLAAIAVPVHGHVETLSILIAGPDHRIEPAYRKLGALLLQLKAKLERDLEGGGPLPVRKQGAR